MIDITKLTKKDIGRWVEYQGSAEEREIGRIKSFNDSCIFVVYKCSGNWNRYKNFTGIATDPKKLIFI